MMTRPARTPVRRLALLTAMLGTPCLLPSTVLAMDGKLTLSASVDYSSGDYGADTDTEVWYFPITAKYEIDRSVFKLTVPYLQVDGPAGCTIIDGRPVCAPTGTVSSEQGLGDVIFAYSYSLTPQPVSGFFFDLSGKVKFATADEDKGLGTGENDYALQADAFYLAGNATPFATLGYRFMGDPEGYDFNDVWYGTLGVDYKLSPDNNVGGLWDVRQKVVDTGDGTSEVMLYWTHRFGGGYKLQTYAVTGFSDASPDYGLGVMLMMSTGK
jgi:hypothetical protein